MAGIRERTESKVKYEPASKLSSVVMLAIRVCLESEMKGSSPKLCTEGWFKQLFNIHSVFLDFSFKFLSH